MPYGVDPYLPPELVEEINSIIENVIFCYKHNDSGDAIPITYTRPNNNNSELRSEFRFDLVTGGQPSCAEVAVDRRLVGADENVQVETEIRSSGYNATCADVVNNTNNPRRIERVVYRVDRVSGQ